MTEFSFPASYESELQQELRGFVEDCHQDVRDLLPTLPLDIITDFDDTYLTPGFGVGGAAYDLTTLKLAYDPGFAEQDELREELRQTVMHEDFHLVNGFSFATTPDNLSALHHAIAEGGATKFEMTHAGSNPVYGQLEDRETMLDWLEEVKGLPDGFDYDWKRYKFSDPETGRKFILYKVGLFIHEEALQKNPDLTIADMATMKPDQVLELAGLA